MHDARPNVVYKALLVAENKCSMRGCFCPTMAVVAVEKALLGEAGLILKQNSCRKVGLLCTLVHKPTYKLVSKVIVGAHRLHLLSMERLELLLAYKVPHKTMMSVKLYEQVHGCLWRGCP
jgi:hypothetical protein